MAWHFKRFEREQSEADRTAYAAAEAEAKAAKRGLWTDAHPLAPWEWRAKRSM
jgi:endonuclease YncB( thermonuclease family)